MVVLDGKPEGLELLSKSFFMLCIETHGMYKQKCTTNKKLFRFQHHGHVVIILVTLNLVLMYDKFCLINRYFLTPLFLVDC